jgi:hypothetical protein
MTASSPQMLPRLWAVRDVADVEMLCRGALAELLRRTNVTLEAVDYDATLAFMLGEVVVLEARFAEKIKAKPGLIFRPWLYQQVTGKAIDHWRSWFGRQGQKRLPDTSAVSPTEDDDGSWCIDQPDPHDDPADRGLGRAAREIAEDGPETRTDALRWVLDEGDRAALQPLRRLGGGAHPGVAGGHRRAGNRERLKEAA